MTIILIHDSMFSRRAKLLELFAEEFSCHHGINLCNFNIKQTQHTQYYHRAVIIGNPTAQDSAKIRHHLQRNNPHIMVQKILFSDVIGTSFLQRFLLIHGDTLLISSQFTAQDMSRLITQWISGIRRNRYSIVRLSQREQEFLQQQNFLVSSTISPRLKKERYLLELALSRLTYRLRLSDTETVYRFWQWLLDERKYYIKEII